MDELRNSLGNTGNEMQQATKRSGGFLSTLGKFATAVGVFKAVNTAVGMVSSSISDAVKRVDTLNNANRVFENMGYSSKETQKAMQGLKDSIQGLPTPLDTAVQGLQLIASSTGDLGKSQEIFSALNNAILGFGGTTGQVENAIIQLSQAFSNGKIDAQSWNSMINSGMGPALSALAKQMGMTTGEFKTGLSEGDISVKKFQNALIELNHNGGGGLKSLEQIAQDSTAGMNTGFSNMKTAVVRGVANVITAFDDALKSLNLGGISAVIATVGESMEAALNKIAETVPVALEALRKVSDWMAEHKELMLAIAGAILEVGTAFIVFKTITGTIATFQKVITVAKAAVTAFNVALAANPIAAVIAVVAALTAGIIYLWNTNEGFREAVIAIWDSIKQAFVTAKDAIVNAWNNTIEFFSNLWESIKTGATEATSAVTNAWNSFKDYLVGIWQSIVGSTVSAWQSFKDTVSNTVATLISGLTGAWNSFTSYLSALWTSIVTVATTAWTAFTNTIKVIIQPFIAYFMNIWNGVKDGLSMIWASIQTIASAAWDLIKNVILAPVLMLVDLITGDFTGMKSHLIQIWGNIKEAAGTIWNGIKGVFTGIVSVITGYVKAQFNNLKAVLTTIWKSVKDTTVATWNKLKDSVKTIVTNLIQSVKDKWTNFKAWFKNMLNVVRDSAKNSWNNLKTSVINTINNLIQGAKDRWNNFKSWIKSAMSSIRSSVTSAWQSLKTSVINTINNLVNGAKNAWNKLTSSVKSAVSNVKSIFNSLRNISLRDIGRNIIQGLVNGVTSKLQAVRDSITNVANTIKNKIKGLLNIHSPSRWMRDMIGSNLMLGITAGIDADADSPVDAMASVASKLKKAAETEGNFSTNFIAQGGRGLNNYKPQGTVTNLLKDNSGNTGSNSASAGGVVINVQSMIVRNDNDVRRIGEELVKQADLRSKARGKVRWDNG